MSSSESSLTSRPHSIRRGRPTRDCPRVQGASEGLGHVLDGGHSSAAVENEKKKRKREQKRQRKTKQKPKKQTNNKHGRMGQGSLAFQVRVSVLVKLVLALKKYVWPIQPITNLTKFDLVQFHCQCETSGAIFLELFRCFFIPSLCADMLVFNQSLTNLTKFDLVQFNCQCETSGEIFLELFRCFFITSLCADMLIFNQSLSPIII